MTHTPMAQGMYAFHAPPVKLMLLKSLRSAGLSGL